MMHNKRILYVTTISATMGFFVDQIKAFIDKGYSVDIACNCKDDNLELYSRLGCEVYDLPFSRSPLSKSNFKAMKQIKKIIKKNNYDIVHTHTPIASACTRIVCKKARKKSLKVVYTAHGFHFYTGAPIINWIVYFPIEYICSMMTDLLICINKDDYSFAINKLKSQKVVYVPGVGISTEKFINVEKTKEDIRKSMGFSDKDFIITSVGELNVNKNHEKIIKVLAEVDKEIHYLVVGKGNYEDYLRGEAKRLSVENRVHFLGFRKDIPFIDKASDLFVFPSYREGLPVSLMEAMASGLACVVSDIRGNRDLVNKDKGGYLVSPNDVSGFVKCINKLYEDRELLIEMGEYNKKAVEQYDSFNIIKKMIEIYESL